MPIPFAKKRHGPLRANLFGQGLLKIRSVLRAATPASWAAFLTFSGKDESLH